MGARLGSLSPDLQSPPTDDPLTSALLLGDTLCSSPLTL